MSETNKTRAEGAFTAESFSNYTNGDKHFVLCISNGKERKLAKVICGVELTIEHYRQMILEKAHLGPFMFTKTNGDKFESMLMWAFKPNKKEMESPMGFLEGGQSRFLSFKRLTGEDPNTHEDVLDHAFSWRFPSTGNKTLSKKIFEVEISFDEAKQIVHQAGPGLTRHDWKSTKTGKTFAATLKWDLEKGTYKLNFVNTKNGGGNAETVPADESQGEPPI